MERRLFGAESNGTLGCKNFYARAVMSRATMVNLMELTTRAAFLAPTKPVKRSIESKAMRKKKKRKKKTGEEKKEKKRGGGGQGKGRREENGPMLLSPWNHHGKGRINLASRRANGPFAPRFRCN